MTHREGMELILKELPEFQSEWNELENGWVIEEPRGSTIDFAAFARFVQQQYIKPNDEQKLDKVAQLIERFIEEGDKDLEYGATMGFLEDVTSSWDPDVRIENLVTHLRPKSIEFCKELVKFWRTSIPGLQD